MQLYICQHFQCLFNDCKGFWTNYLKHQWQGSHTELATAWRKGRSFSQSWNMAAQEKNPLGKFGSSLFQVNVIWFFPWNTLKTFSCWLSWGEEQRNHWRDCCTDRNSFQASNSLALTEVTPHPKDKVHTKLTPSRTGEEWNKFNLTVKLNFFCFKLKCHEALPQTETTGQKIP